jgi:hypothetical protein
MKTLKAVLLVSCLGIFLASTAPAGGDAVSGQKGARTTVYDAREKCQVVCRAPKPFLAILEDGLAYALDIPLAMLSPITCPVISSFLDESDSGSRRNRRLSK